MNLHQIASGSVGSVNPFVPLRIRVSTGYATNADYSRAPTYAAVQTVPGQVQSLTFDDLKQIEGLNIQGTRRAVYINGRVDGLVRLENKGGDLVEVPGASFNGYIAGNVLTVTKINSGRISLRDTVFGSGVVDGTKITALGTGLGYEGTYILDTSQTLAPVLMASGTVWLLVHMLEQWPDWCKFIVTLQDGS